MINSESEVSSSKGDYDQENPNFHRSLVRCAFLPRNRSPALDIDAKVHPNLYDAQKHVIAANHAIELAQKDNRYDMQGHAEKARELLVQVNQELKAAAAAASAAAKKH